MTVRKLFSLSFNASTVVGCVMCASLFDETKTKISSFVHFVSRVFFHCGWVSVCRQNSSDSWKTNNFTRKVLNKNRPKRMVGGKPSVKRRPSCQTAWLYTCVLSLSSFCFRWYLHKAIRVVMIFFWKRWVIEQEEGRGDGDEGMPREQRRREFVGKREGDRERGRECVWEKVRNREHPTNYIK